MPGGIVTSYGYDAANRLTSVTHSDAAARVLASFLYTLDASGRRRAVSEARRDPVTTLLAGDTTAYGYDAQGRLTGESGGIAGTLSYTYDAVGNRLGKTANGIGVGYTYDANDRMLTEGAKSFGYDANGNTVSAGGQTLRYDFEDRLVATQLNGVAVTFAYDADGNRIRKIADGNVTSYLPETVFAPYAQVAEEREGVTGRLAARYDTGVALSRVDRYPAGGGTAVSSYFLQDGQGSTVALTDGGGVLTDSYGYDTFGNPTHLAGGAANSFLFNGQQFDEETGLYYLRARYYAPGQGRFLTHDPVMGGGGDPTSLHRYLYAACNPVNFVDPSGKAIEDLSNLQIGIGVAVTIGAVATISWLANDEYQKSAIRAEAATAAASAVGISSDLLNNDGKNLGAKQEFDAMVSRVNNGWLAIPQNQTAFDYKDTVATKDKVDHLYLKLDDGSLGGDRIFVYDKKKVRRLKGIHIPNATGDKLYISSRAVEEGSLATALAIFAEYQHSADGGKMSEYDAQKELALLKDTDRFIDPSRITPFIKGLRHLDSKVNKGFMGFDGDMSALISSLFNW